MKNKPKKRTLRKGPFVLFLLLAMIFFVGGRTLLFLPITEYQANPSSKAKLENYLQPLSFLGFLPSKTLLALPIKEIVGESYPFKNIDRIGLFRWKIQICEPTSVFLVSINNFLYPCDCDGNILTIPNVTGSLLQGNEEILYTITIPPPQIDTSQGNVMSSPPRFDFVDIYNQHIQPFVEYIVQSSSHLGPQITHIDYTPEEGLKFIKSSTSGHTIQCIFGNETAFSNLEKKLDAAELYLKKQNTFLDFNCIDVRFRRQAVCSNTKDLGKEESEQKTKEEETTKEDTTETP
ncbi:MAG: hypothetical protein PHI40_02795 [Caldisericia bacterium]|nr:hypothetical protein [Caldisericia bacterium]MDD4614320.1 hypothetical protein [Caldisericia bacterium]